jgi:hypothetical protein
MDAFTHLLLRIGDDIAALVSSLYDVFVDWLSEMYLLLVAIVIGASYLAIALKLAELN